MSKVLTGEEMEGHSKLRKHHAVMTIFGAWTSANTLALIVWHNTVMGEAREETRDREELAIEGLTC